MKIERYRAQQGSTGCNKWLAGCGCIGMLVVLVSIGAGLLIVFPRLPQLALVVAGFEAQGETAQQFEPQATRAPTLAAVDSQPDSITINAPRIGSRTVQTGSSSNIQAQVGGGEMQLTTDESGLLALCRQYSAVCTPTGENNIRNASFDLRNGGMIVNAEVNVPQVNTWQQVGIVMRFEGTQVRVSGVDVGGTLYAAPPDGIGTVVRDAEQLANDLLTQFTVNSGASLYDLNGIYADDTTLTLVLR